MLAYLSDQNPIQFTQKKVLVRCDFNVPLQGEDVTDPTRILANLETIKWLLAADPTQVILMSHLGRPKGQVVPHLSLQPIREYLQQQLNQDIPLVSDWRPKHLDSKLVLLENTRFNPQEKQNGAQFGQQLAEWADFFVFDAFGTAHRAHASTLGVQNFLPSFLGLTVEKELSYLSNIKQDPARPFVVLVGGAKIADKAGALAALSKQADVILVGGGVANLFLKASKFDIAASLVQLQDDKGTDYLQYAQNLLHDTANERFLLDGVPIPKILYPIDVIAGRSIKTTKPITISLAGRDIQTDVRDDLRYLDIGPKTIQLFKKIISQAATVFWNGPMGVFEHPPTSTGTQVLAQAVATSPAQTIIGGGDTLRALKMFDISQDQFSHVSTGGGASLHFLAGEKLPAIDG